MAGEQFETLVIGGGQAGLSVGYHLARQGRDLVILDANARVGDAWRRRWDSLRLFTPSRYNGLDGMPFPGPARAFPGKDEVADYLEAYAERFGLPVRTSVRVTRLCREGRRFVAEARSGTQPLRFESENVVVAMGSQQAPFTPAYARDLRPGIITLHSADYRNPGMLQDGDVLVVGAGNSGAEIALEVATGHRTWLAGVPSGWVPFRVDTVMARTVLLPLMYRLVGHRVLTVRTPIGRHVRPTFISHAAPVIRVKRGDLAAAGVGRLPRVAGVRDGLPVLEDGRTAEVANVIWCTGLRPDFSWLDLPVFGQQEEPTEPIHERGVVAAEPGLYFVGLPFLYAMSSGFLPGVGRDAAYVVERIIASSRRAGHTLPGGERLALPGTP
jgi:putative flavoprotein involved in K+ transport